MSPTFRAHIALLIVSIIYGANYVIAKEVLDNEYIQPLGFILMRILSAAIVFTIIHLLFVREKVDRQDMKRLVVCGLLGSAINQMFFFSGLKLTSPITASLILTMIPIGVLIFSALILKSKITGQKIIGIVMGMSGAVLLIWKGNEIGLNKNQLWGNCMIFINATSYALYLVIAKPLLKKYHPITIVRWVFTFGLIFTLPFGFQEAISVDWSTFHQGTWLAFGYVLLCTTILAYLLNAFALKLVAPTVVGFYVYLQPLIAALIAVAFLQESITTNKVIAAILIFGGVYLVSLKSNRKTRFEKK